MSKVLILGDLHIGVRNGSSIFLNQTKDFLYNTLYPYIKNNNIDTVIQLGDILDKRKQIDFVSSAFLFKHFFEWFIKNDVTLFSTLGNHDIYYKSSVKTSGIFQFAEIMDNGIHVQIINEPTIITRDNISFKLIPWICDENKDQCISVIQQEIPNSVICGHFELANFNIQKNVVSASGSIDEELLYSANHVFSGHYHTPSDKKNIHYIGSPYCLTWNDYGDNKKFIVYDTDKDTYEEIFTKNSLFVKIIYETGMKFVKDSSIPEGAFIKIIVNEIDNALDLYIKKLVDAYNPSSYQIINVNDTNMFTDIDCNIEIDNPFDIMIKTVNTLKDVNTDYIKNELSEIYKKASNNINANI